MSDLVQTLKGFLSPGGLYLSMGATLLYSMVL